MENNLFDQNLRYALINQNNGAFNEFMTPQLIVNSKNDNLWNHFYYELRNCDSFVWVIAFITNDMLAPLKVILKEETKRGLHGTIITGTYLNFNEPSVFAELLKIPNITLKVCDLKGFHIKGYLFKYKDYQNLYIGSANFTRSALLKNNEWNLRLTSTNEGALVKIVNSQITQLELHSTIVSATWINNYRQNYHKKYLLSSTKTSLKHIIPNKMQQDALFSLTKLKNQGVKKALIISATGTGKTYLSAFWTKKFKPHRLLFITHREEILKKTLQSFQEIISEPLSNFGILSGHTHQWERKYLFATIQTLAQVKNLTHFTPNDFDLIIIDEAHHAVANTYQKVINYFKPKFLLGMTATPERMDEYDVFKLFDYQIAYEIRLQTALSENMLCPFHYIGVSDYVYKGETITELTPLKKLIAPQRVDYILKQVEYYGNTYLPIYGLVFCSRTNEAIELAKIFTIKGYPAIALTNHSSREERKDALFKLKKQEIKYIITVDLFNEGIDIPYLNQIIMLRSTKSSTIFTQQLGRGLRKFPGKKSVTIIDFIGNYNNNYLIPIALNGSQNYQKDQIRNQLLNDNVKGISTINFTEIAQKRILDSLAKVKLNSLMTLKKYYEYLKKKIGRVPLLADFNHFSSFGAINFIEDPYLDNYAQFLLKMKEI